MADTKDGATPRLEDAAMREMTLDEYLAQLPSIHLARRQCDTLKERVRELEGALRKCGRH